MVNDVIVKFIDDLKAKQQIRLFDEAATKQAIILPILQLLGWSIFYA